MLNRGEASMRRLISRRAVILLLLSALLLSSHPLNAVGAGARATRRTNAGSARVVGWDALPAILARIKPPRFPARDFKITDYGATAGGTSDATDAIRKAIT